MEGKTCDFVQVSVLNLSAGSGKTLVRPGMTGP
jgi:hypothetical protein